MSKMFKDSLKQAFVIVTGVATVFTVLGFSMKDAFPLNEVKPDIFVFIVRILILAVTFVITVAFIYIIKHVRYRNSISLCISRNHVDVEYGNIFEKEGWRVIAVDTTFSTEVDDVVISKSSLHGQLVLNHGDSDSIKEVVKKEAVRRGIKSKNGVYTFKPGTAIPYDGNDGHYIMVALNELNKDHEAHTKLSQYESTLMEMWRELNRVYAGNKLILPILGSGITRFDDGQDESVKLLRCMLCTLNTSKIHFKSNISIIKYSGGGKKEKIPLYEYRSLFKISI